MLAICSLKFRVKESAQDEWKERFWCSFGQFKKKVLKSSGQSQCVCMCVCYRLFKECQHCKVLLLLVTEYLCLQFDD